MPRRRAIGRDRGGIGNGGRVDTVAAVRALAAATATAQSDATRYSQIVGSVSVKSVMNSSGSIIS